MDEKQSKMKLEDKPVNQSPEQRPGAAQRFMTPPDQMSDTAILVEGAMMAALGFVLSLIPFFHMPWGGSITCFSTLPIIVMSLRHGMRRGVFTAAVYGVIQAIQGAGTVAIAGNAGAMMLCVLLDYFLAYAAVGLTGPIARWFVARLGGRVAGSRTGSRTGSVAGSRGGNGGGVGGGDAAGGADDTPLSNHAADRRTAGLTAGGRVAGLTAGIVATGLMRLACSFVSGILIWGAWAPEGTPVWRYSLGYNAGWCLPDVAIVLFAAIALSGAPGMHILDLPHD